VVEVEGGTLPRFLATEKKENVRRGARTCFLAEPGFFTPGVKTPYDTPKGMIQVSQYEIVGR